MIDLERAVPDLERPPTHPGPDGVAVLPVHPFRPTTLIQCSGMDGHCRNNLGSTDGTYLFLKIKYRRVTAFLPVSIRCEKCGAQNRCVATRSSADG